MKYLVIIAFLATLPCFAQEGQVFLHPNRGQWDNRIDYKVDLHGGFMVVENAGFSYLFTNWGHAEDHKQEPENKRVHVIRQEFSGIAAPQTSIESKKSGFYRNYFLSNDRSEWVSEAYSFQQVKRTGVYPGIDLELLGGNASLKYSWIVSPNADPAAIKWSYKGSEKTEITAEGLTISHEFGTILEQKPAAWTIHNGKKINVPVRFTKSGDFFSFSLGNYNHNDTLVIDPSLVFSTFTGSTSDNWGFTACPDKLGNLYAGGIVMGTGYPLTPGAYDPTFSGGPGGAVNIGNDISITKFNATGTSMIFSTLLGGNKNETPHSIVTNSNNELFVFGVTASTDFPMGTNAFDPSFNGGPTQNNVNEIRFDGSDIFITHFNPAGNTLLGSTYVGGSQADGLNESVLNFNYGDPFRGEIIVDDQYVYVSSTTQSPNFPTVQPFQATLNGSQDAVVFKMNQSLTTMVWSSYLGGSGVESGNGIALNTTGNVFVTGGTNSSDFNLDGGMDISFDGGQADGYLVKLNITNGQMQSGTFIGTGDYDQCYFVQTDPDNNVYVLGQTQGGLFPVSPGVYANPGSGQFVMKFNPGITASLWSTTIGAGSGFPEISPTAFLVSDCKDIYITGWGGNVNIGNSSYAQHSTTNGFPFTGDAFQPTTNGSNFWLGVLAEDAAFLKYATFMGGTTSSMHHVDGGTSRFDKRGNVYHAVCGACGGVDHGFTTTSGAWSMTNNSNNCNLAAFKFQLNVPSPIINQPQAIVCLPDPVQFTGNTSNGNLFFWNFGDNTTSTQINPTHAYAGPGNYTVSLVVTDTTDCFIADTTYFQVSIGDFQGGIIQPTGTICPGSSYQLEAFGGSIYHWSPAQYLDDASVSNPTATISTTTTFTCIISDTCGIDTVSVDLVVDSGNLSISNDTTICIGNQVALSASGADNITWSPPTYLNTTTGNNVISSPTESITYHAEGTTSTGCSLTGDVVVTVVTTPPQPQLQDTLTYCAGKQGFVQATGADTYAWESSPYLETINSDGSMVLISSPVSGYFTCDFTNICASIPDSVFVNVISGSISVSPDTTVCFGQIVDMEAFQNVKYWWFPNDVGYLNTSRSKATYVANSLQTFMVVGENQYGCRDTAYTTVSLFPRAFIQTSPDVYAIYGDQITLTATSTTSGIYVWSPPEYLSCVSCQSPTATPPQNMTYTVSYTDENGCSASDNVIIRFDPMIYVPNAFTPDGNFYNDYFFPVVSNVKDYSYDVYNRWGELIYTGDNTTAGWDGTYVGLKSPDGVYTWKLKYTDYNDDSKVLTGHTTLLR